MKWLRPRVASPTLPPPSLRYHASTSSMGGWPQVVVPPSLHTSLHLSPTSQAIEVPREREDLAMAREVELLVMQGQGEEERSRVVRRGVAGSSRASTLRLPLRSRVRREGRGGRGRRVREELVRVREVREEGQAREASQEGGREARSVEAMVSLVIKHLVRQLVGRLVGRAWVRLVQER